MGLARTAGWGFVLCHFGSIDRVAPGLLWGVVMRTVLSTCGILLAFAACSSLAEWLSLQPVHHDPVGASMVGGGLFTVAIGVLIRD